MIKQKPEARFQPLFHAQTMIYSVTADEDSSERSNFNMKFDPSESNTSGNLGEKTKLQKIDPQDLI